MFLTEAFLTEGFQAALNTISGAELLAQAVDTLLPKNSVICGVPGSPTTALLTILAHSRGAEVLSSFDELDLFARLIGATAARRPAVGIMKHNGFLRVQELMGMLVNHKLQSSLVLIVGDEQGQTSQIAIDTRVACDMYDTPIIEPSINNFYESFLLALEVSSSERRPVVVRVTTTAMETHIKAAHPQQLRAWIQEPIADNRDYFASEGLLRSRQRSIQIDKLNRMHVSRTNEVRNLNRLSKRCPDHLTDSLVVCSGAAVMFANDLRLKRFDLWELNALCLLDEVAISDILKTYTRVLVLENWTPYVESRLRLALKWCGNNSTEILGRLSTRETDALIPSGTGELSQNQVMSFISFFLDGRFKLASAKQDNFPFIEVELEEKKKYQAVYAAIEKTAEESDLVACLSVSTGRTRYSVMHSRFEKMVNFMPTMGFEAQVLMGFLDYCHNLQALAPGVVLGDFTFEHSAWKGVVQLGHYRQKNGVKIPTVILVNGGSITTGGQKCTQPHELGPVLIAKWQERFLGIVDAQNGELLNVSIARLFSCEEPADILVVQI